MPYKNVILRCTQDKVNTVNATIVSPLILEKHYFTLDTNESLFYFLLADSSVQELSDTIQNIIPDKSSYIMQILTVDAIIPQPTEVLNKKSEEDVKDKKRFLGVSREELLEKVRAGVQLDLHFFLLIIFSTVVVSIGLLENNVAVVIGGMVIAPLLGPNLALAFAITLGDIKTMQASLKANMLGVSLCFMLSLIMGYFWSKPLNSPQLLMRSSVSFDSIILALVSGSAAVLSLTRGISSTLVGVMVAVALLPPATAMGIFAGAGELSHAYSALILLSANIVSINLSAQLTLFLKGVTPRTWYQRKVAKTLSKFYLIAWIVLLACISAIVYTLQLKTV